MPGPLVRAARAFAADAVAEMLAERRRSEALILDAPTVDQATALLAEFGSLWDTPARERIWQRLIQRERALHQAATIVHERARARERELAKRRRAPHPVHEIRKRDSKLDEV